MATPPYQQHSSVYALRTAVYIGKYHKFQLQKILVVRLGFDVIGGAGGNYHQSEPAFAIVTGHLQFIDSLINQATKSMYTQMS